MRKMNNIFLTVLLGFSTCFSSLMDIHANEEINIGSMKGFNIEVFLSIQEEILDKEELVKEIKQEEIKEEQEKTIDTNDTYVEPVYTYVEPVYTYQTIKTVSYVEDDISLVQEEVVVDVPLNNEYAIGDYVEPTGTAFEYVNPVDATVPVYEVADDSITDEYVEEIHQMLDDIINSTPIETEEVLPLISDNNKNLFVENNNDDLYTVESIDSNSDQSSYIYIVDENALVYVIQDSEGNGIGDANVSISYLENDSRVQRTIETSDGNVKGIAAFDDMKGTRYGLVDITVDGYHSVTFLEDEMTGGNTRNVVLEKNVGSQLYIRAVDLDGRDLVNNDTTLSLIDGDVKDYRFSILVSQTGNATLPNEVRLVSSSDGRVIYTFDQPISYEGSNNTYLFTATDQWVSQAGPLKENDELIIEFGDTKYSLKNVTVKNAICTPSFTTDKQMNLKGQEMIGKFEDQSPFLEMFNLGITPLALNVSFGQLPNGNYYILCTKKLQSLSKEMKETFEQSVSPKVAEKTGTLMDKILASLCDDLMNGLSKYEDASEHSNFMADPTYGYIRSVVSAMISGSYNEEIQKYQGDLTIGFAVNVGFGKQAYALIAGFIPFTFGGEFNYNLSFKTTQAILADTIFPIPSIEYDTWKTKPFQVRSSPSLKFYAGVGLRGFSGVDFTAMVGLDFANIFHDENKPGLDLEEPHKFIDVAANLSANVYALLLTKTIQLLTIPSTRIVDNWQPFTPTEVYLVDDGEFVPLDLDVGKEAILELLSSYEDGKLETYSIDVPSVNAPSDLELLSNDSFIDNQIQLISTKDTTALFRMIAKDGVTKLVYQLQDPATGEFENILHEIPMPDDRCVYEFMVTDQKYEQYKIPQGYVYIGAVTGDIDSTDAHDRAHSTSVVSLIVDIDEGKLIQSKVVAQPNENAYYFSPLPAHVMGDMVIAYKEADCFETSNQYKNYMVTLDGTKVLMSENVPVYSANVGNSLWKATYWTVDSSNTDKNTLKLIGYNVEGKQQAYKQGDTDPDHIWNNFRVSFDISDFVEKFPDSNPVSCVGSLRGKEYWIVGGKLYRLVLTDGTTPIEVKEVEASPLSNVSFNGGNNHYQMLTNHELGTLFITSLKSVLETEEGTTNSKLIGNELELSYVVETENDYGTHYILHGPRTYFLEGVDAYRYTCSYNSHDMGIELVVDAYHDENKNSCDVYAWQEKAGYGFTLKDFYVEKNMVSNTEEYLKGYITYENTGYGTADTITIQVKDSTGKILNQAQYDPSTNTYTDLGEIVGYSKEVMYPADVKTIPIWFKTNPDWSTNSEVEIIVSMLNEKKEVVSESSLTFNQPRVIFKGKQEVLNGDHYASFQFTNQSAISSTRGKVVLVADYKDKTNEDIIASFSTGNGVIVSGGTYNITYNIEDIWQNIGEDVVGLNAYLVSEDGQYLTDSPIYIKNPYYGKQKKQEDIPTKEEDVIITPTPIVEVKQETVFIKQKREKKQNKKATKYPILYIDGKEVRVDSKLSTYEGISGYLLYMEVDGKEVLIGILSEDGLTVTLFEDYTLALEDKEEHEAILEYEDGKKEALVVEIFEKEEEEIKEETPSTIPDDTSSNRMPLFIGLFSLLFILICILYKKFKK